MVKLSNRMLILSSAGYGVIFSIVLTKIVRIISGLSGQPISAEVEANIFLISVLTTAPLAGYFKIARIFVAGVSEKSSATKVE